MKTPNHYIQGKLPCWMKLGTSTFPTAEDLATSTKNHTQSLELQRLPGKDHLITHFTKLQASDFDYYGHIF